jgi:hypothetical protein
MKNHETVQPMTAEQFGDIIATMVVAVPRLSFEQAQAIISEKGPFATEIRSLFRLWQTVREQFFLAVNHKNILPDFVQEWMGQWMNLESTTWKYIGPSFSGVRNYNVELVRLGSYSPYYNLDHIRKIAQERNCRLLEGQAVIPFMARFLQSDRFLPIIFGGSEWENKNGDANVIVIENRTVGKNNVLRPFFCRSDFKFGAHCFWAVVPIDQ